MQKTGLQNQNAIGDMKVVLPQTYAADRKGQRYSKWYSKKKNNQEFLFIISSLGNLFKLPRPTKRSKTKPALYGLCCIWAPDFSGQPCRHSPHQ